MAISKKEFMKAKELTEEITRTKIALRNLEAAKKSGYKLQILKIKKLRFFLKRPIDYEIPIDIDDIDYLIGKQLKKNMALEKELAEIVTE